MNQVLIVTIAAALYNHEEILRHAVKKNAPNVPFDCLPDSSKQRWMGLAEAAARAVDRYSDLSAPDAKGG